MARWPGGAVARWRGGAVARWRGGAVARWRGGAVARWRGGAVAQWRTGALGRTSNSRILEPEFESYTSLGKFVHCTLLQFNHELQFSIHYISINILEAKLLFIS